MMTREQYLIEAARTCPNLSNKLEDKIHMILGIIDEWFEFNELIFFDEDTMIEEAEHKVSSIEDQVKELGDVYWYLANLARITDNEDAFAGRFSNKTTAKLLPSAAKLAGLFKKELAYGKIPHSSEVTFKIRQMSEAMRRVCKSFNFNEGNVLKRNIQKLRARFPDKFDQQLAINKDESRE